MDVKRSYMTIGRANREENSFSYRHGKLVVFPLLIIFCSLLISIALGFPEVSRLNDVPQGFDARLRATSERYEPGTNATLVQNAKIWTGSDHGKQVIHGDLLLHQGIIKAFGDIPKHILDGIDKDQLTVLDAKGAWVTPGLVDLHSHIGVGSSPQLRGAADTNSLHGTIQPWLRSLDGLNTHDESYRLSIAGGVTTAQILPGSANNIGGQAFVIKLRSTLERSAISKVIEPPHTLNGTTFAQSTPPRWRHMKHACGENPSRVYSATRMDSIWAFRQAYNEARKIRDAQNAYCTRAKDGDWEKLGEWPEDLKWEALVDVLRGRVKLAVHCYEPVDFDGIVRLTNEFEFPVASFHHAGSAYLVPDLLKKVYGGAPAVALFASNFRKKREAYRGSEFGPRILADNNIRVVMKSDHPVINSRYLLNEAALAFYYGLPANLALSSVTTVPAQAAGFDHRIGHIKEDIVVWDSHPLTLGATPVQSFIDGIPQIERPVVSLKPDSFQELPQTPNFDKEAAETVEYEGLPPLATRHEEEEVLFTNVRNFWVIEDEEIVDSFSVGQSTRRSLGSVLVQKGKVTCVQNAGQPSCINQENTDSMKRIDLEGGSLAPGLTTFGSAIGTDEIRLEPSTNDGPVFDPLQGPIPKIIGEDGFLIRAVDGLQFEGRNMLLAYRAGVTTAVTPPTGYGFAKGISAAFHTGATNALEKGAIIQEIAAFHVGINKAGAASVSTQIAALRNLLLSSAVIAHVASVQGEIPIVVHVENADIMATLLRLKDEIEAQTGGKLRLSFAGAAEAWRLALAIGKADVGVILTPSRSFPATWDQRRILPGPPLTYDTPLTVLFKNNVTVAIGSENEYDARNIRFDLAWRLWILSGCPGI
ncbi:hypothetical protein M422DRAFT_62391 [Sphaerobolus stellatus SS14]|uniref:Amidohydrolase-related domain-containing protein n=1 Tax=Sphaerobolus stellatus (strain SS14) TaxID=990650 RepID=A0A0C9TPK8_SPHS4|nr:hypothetical protein M422DRAFT_62391 [Sphaerobolus stellatus SS14]